MKQRHPLTAFYIETLLMIIVFVGIILCITRVFGRSRQQSRDAQQLTDAVCLAQNAAEAFSAAETPEEMQELLEMTGIAQPAADGSGLTCLFGKDLRPSEDGDYLLQMQWSRPAEDAPLYAVLSVSEGGQELYSLETAAAGKEGW